MTGSVARPPGKCKLLSNAGIGATWRRTAHEETSNVTIGDDSPHSRRLLSYLAPQCPTTMPLLPETVRSGTGSVNPKPPAHGALAGSNQPWFLQGTRCDDPKTIEPVSAPNWHRFFAACDLGSFPTKYAAVSGRKTSRRNPEPTACRVNPFLMTSVGRIGITIPWARGHERLQLAPRSYRT